MHDPPQDYGDNTMAGAMAMEAHFSEFFLNVKAILRRSVRRAA